MSRTRKCAKRQRGVGLVMALLTMLVLSVLAAGLLMVTNTEIGTTANYRLVTQARYAAEAGAQSTANWLMSYNPGPTNTTGLDTATYPVQLTANNSAVVLSAISGVSSNYPDSTVQSAFNSALGNQSMPGLTNVTYSATATLLSMTPVGGSGTQYLQTWQIISQSSITGFSNAQVQVTETIQRIVGTPLYTYAIYAPGNGCSSVILSDGASTDSFDSSAGTYAATQQNTSGDVATNGNLNMSDGSTRVNGTLSDPNSGSGTCGAGGTTAITASGGASVTGGVVTVGAPIGYADPAAPSPAPPSTNPNLSGNCGSPASSGCTNLSSNNVAVAPGTYGNLTVSGGTSIHLSAGTYDLNSLVLSGGSPLVVDSGPVTINVAGSGKATAIDLSGGRITNSGGLASDCQFLYDGTAAVKLSGGSESYAVVNAPNAAIKFSGGSNWYGAVIGATVNDSVGTTVHYDRSLAANNALAGKFQVIGFTWNKF